MRLSVALCTYNGAAYLPAQLASLAAQDRLPDELVVSDDGSTDETLAVVGAFARGAPFPVRVSRNDVNLGFAQNFARAISLCDGDLIALCDQDDVWRPSKLAMQEGVLAAHPAIGLVCSDADLVGEALQPVGLTLFGQLLLAPAERELIARGRATTVLLERNVAMGASTVFRSRFREAILPIPPGWHHDWWIALMASLQARVALLDEALLDYRQHGANALGAPVPEAATLDLLVRSSIHPRTAQFLREELQWRGALNRVEALGEGGTPNATPGELASLRAKVRHLGARANLPAARRKRVASVVAELIAGNYRRYSAGTASALKDLLVRQVPPPGPGGPPGPGRGSG